MKIMRVTLVLMVMFMLSASVSGQQVVDYLNCPGPLKIEEETYSLIWSSHPTDNYYKQEYLMKSDNLESYRNLILLDVVVTDKKPIELASTMISRLDKLKESNPVVNYTVLENGDEVMLDFLMSENSPDGSAVKIIERNVYRYKTFQDNSGKRGVLLFGVSQRAYGEDVTPFYRVWVKTSQSC